MTHVCIYLQLEPVNANTVGRGGVHRKSPYKWGIQGNILRIKRSDLINILTIERIVQHYKQHCGKVLFKSFF